MSTSAKMKDVNHETMYCNPNESASTEADLKDIRNSIWKRIHEIYGMDNSDEFYQTNLWAEFIKNLLGIGSLPLNIFTTNYDKVFEGTIIHNKFPIEDGMVTKPGGTTVLNMERRISFRSERTKGSLTKLHGSTNWRRVGEEIQCSDLIGRLFDPADMAILYPGFKGRSLKDVPFPFGSFYGDLKDISTEADKLIFVGYSFRDEQINQILEEGISDNLNDPLGEIPAIVVIDKNSSPDAPEIIRNHSHIIGGEFDARSIKDCIRYLEGKKSVRRSRTIITKDKVGTNNTVLSEENWIKVVETFKQSRQSLYDALCNTSVMTSDGHTLTLHFTPENAVHKSRAKRNSSLIETTIEVVTGKSIKVEVSELQEG